MNLIKTAQNSVWPKILQKYEKLNVHFAKWIVNIISVYCKTFVFFSTFFQVQKTYIHTYVLHG